MTKPIVPPRATPRTDRRVFTINGQEFVTAKFARRLERELDDFRTGVPVEITRVQPRATMPDAVATLAGEAALTAGEGVTSGQPVRMP